MTQASPRKVLKWGGEAVLVHLGHLSTMLARDLEKEQAYIQQLLVTQTSPSKVLR